MVPPLTAASTPPEAPPKQLGRGAPSLRRSAAGSVIVVVVVPVQPPASVTVTE